MDEAVILIVEDVEQNRKVLRKSILKDFSNVLEAKNGVEALSTVSDNHNIDLILLDLMMPEMDGIEFLRNLNNRDKDIPIIVLSATSEVKMAVDSLRLGARDFIEKPYKKDVILKRVNELLREREGLQQSNLLFVGEEFSYGALLQAFEDKSDNVVVAPNFNEAIDLLKDNTFSVLITDLSNNRDAIRTFLQEVHSLYPTMISVVTAREEDKVLVYDLVDEGLIRDMALDPVEMGELSMTVMNSVLYYQESNELQVLKDRTQL